MAKPVTNIMAEPIPWKTRNTISDKVEGARAQRKDATVNKIIPYVNIFFRPCISHILPNGTANIAAASKNPLTTQLSRIASAPKLAPMAGKARFTDVPINGVKKEAILATTRATSLIPSSVPFTLFSDMIRSSSKKRIHTTLCFCNSKSSSVVNFLPSLNLRNISSAFSFS